MLRTLNREIVGAGGVDHVVYPIAPRTADIVGGGGPPRKNTGTGYSPTPDDEPAEKAGSFDRGQKVYIGVREVFGEGGVIGNGFETSGISVEPQGQTRVRVFNPGRVDRFPRS